MSGPTFVGDLPASDDHRRYAPATERNRAPLLDVLRRVLPTKPDALVLELAAGTGEHAAYFSSALSHLRWLPTDVGEAQLASIDAWRSVNGGHGQLPAKRLDVMDAVWQVPSPDAIVTINLIHIAPWAVTEALMRAAGALLPPGAPLVLYGPYRVGGAHVSTSNLHFDDDLRSRDPAWGVRDLEAVIALGAQHELVAEPAITMPANNLTVVLRRA